MKRLLKSGMFIVKLSAILFFILAVDACSNAITGKSIENSPYENISLSVYFCPKDNCENAIVAAIGNAKKSIHCAFFDLDLEKLVAALKRKSQDIDVRIVIDKGNYDDRIKGLNIKLAQSKQYMHNKFCILDGKTVLTGSMNPTYNDARLNNNNLLIAQSKYFSENYEDEFNELWNGIYSSGSHVLNKKLSSNLGDFENYFCPDDCTLEYGGGINRVIALVHDAKKSVQIAAFSLTHEGLGDELVKASIRGVNVTIVLESKQRNVQNSQYERLKDFEINIKTDGNKYNMHHKFAVIDDTIVVTGSTNFSLSGNNKNDENMMIIFNKNAAEIFLLEFNRLFDLGK